MNKKKNAARRTSVKNFRRIMHTGWWNYWKSEIKPSIKIYNRKKNR